MALSFTWQRGNLKSPKEILLRKFQREEISCDSLRCFEILENLLKTLRLKLVGVCPKLAEVQNFPKSSPNVSKLETPMKTPMETPIETLHRRRAFGFEV